MATVDPRWLSERLLDLLGVSPEEALVDEPLEGPTELDQLGLLLPVRLQRFDAPLEIAVEGIQPRRPLLLLDGDGDPLILTERVGRLVAVEDASGGRTWLELDDLARRLGVGDPRRELGILSVEPREGRRDYADELAPWREAAAILRGDTGDLGAIVVYAVGVGILSLAMPLAVQMLVNAVAFGTVLQPIVVLALLLGGGLVFAAALRAAQTWVVELVQRRLFVRVVGQAGDRILRAQTRAFERVHGPELLNRIFDVFSAQKAVASLLLQGVESVLTSLFGLLLLGLYHPVLLGFGLAILVGAGIVFVFLGRGATRTTLAESGAKYAVAEHLQVMAHHMHAVKMAGGGERAMQRLDALAGEWLRHRAAHFRVVFRQILGGLGLQVLASSVLLGLGGWLVIERELSIGQLVAAEIVVTAVVASLSKLSSKLETVYDLVAAADKLWKVLHLPTERADGAPPPPAHGATRVEISGLVTEHADVVGLDLEISRGEVVAITGSPRATAALVEHVVGLREPQKGAIRIDGFDLRDANLAMARERIAFVREAEVWPSTVLDNVRAVRRAVSVSRVWEVLELVGLASMVRKLPDALYTKLLPSGAPLPRLGGARLTLARALAADPGLLVLEGALDAFPPGEARNLLDRLARGRTVLLVTTSPQLADRATRRVHLRSEARE
jgi:putative ABC transport system ATP-binding protein